MFRTTKAPTSTKCWTGKEIYEHWIAANLNRKSDNRRTHSGRKELRDEATLHWSGNFGYLDYSLKKSTRQNVTSALLIKEYTQENTQNQSREVPMSYLDTLLMILIEGGDGFILDFGLKIVLEA